MNAIRGYITGVGLGVALLSAPGIGMAQALGTTPESASATGATALLAELLGQGLAPLDALQQVLARYGDDPQQVRAAIAATIEAMTLTPPGGSAPTQAQVDAASTLVIQAALSQVTGDSRDAVFQGALLAGADPTQVAALSATGAGATGAGGQGQPAPLGTPPAAGGGGGSGGGVSPSA